ncbi:MAG TPA: hypothetical protein VN203_22860, partial [Candidatus Acidoferrum sp.]|nr:hypothetical protein [Candidatus Acidoferrum sp.]
VPAHIVFVHLNASVAHKAPAVILAFQDGFIRVVDVALLLAILYHGGYGLVSVLGDYLPSRALRIGTTLIIILVMAVCAVYRFA